MLKGAASIGRYRVSRPSSNVQGAEDWSVCAIPCFLLPGLCVGGIPDWAIGWKIVFRGWLKSEAGVVLTGSSRAGIRQGWETARGS